MTSMQLPLDIITEILVLLPVKSLVRFKCVSKEIQALISNTQFINTHLNLSSTNPDSTRIIMKTIYRPQILKSYSLQSVLDSHPHNAQELDYPLKETNPSIQIYGSSNGLVCICITDDLFIWNPSTRVSKKLPGYEVANMRISMRFTVCGFGFNEHSDDYKVVVIFEGKTGVYSLKADCWKTISDFSCYMGELHLYGKLVNGSLHWKGKDEISYDFDPEYSMIIVYLDLLNETYGEIEVPDYGINYYFHLGILQGCLCVLADFRPVCSDLWIMKEYGVKDSWVKLYALPYLEEPYSPRLLPLSILSSGELLIRGMIVVLYNPSDGTYREACVQKNNDLYFYEATYVDSLVSPHLNGL